MTALLSAGNLERGSDSYGWYSHNTLNRHLGNVTHSASKIANANLVVAHTRHATTGAVTVENCHPFKYGDVVGAHNGVISNHEALNAKFDRKCEVDSQHIFMNLNEGKDLEDLRGYGSITWMHVDSPEVVYLCKLNNGELSVAHITADLEGKRSLGVVWSSDSNHLEAALDAIGEFYTQYKIETGQVYSATKEGLYLTKQKLKFTEINYSYYNWRKGPNVGVEDPELSDYMDKDDSTRWSSKGYHGHNDFNDDYPYSEHDLDNTGEIAGFDIKDEDEIARLAALLEEREFVPGTGWCRTLPDGTQVVEGSTLLPGNK